MVKIRRQCEEVVNLVGKLIEESDRNSLDSWNFEKS